MLTFPRYKFMRKYTTDVFYIMRRKKASRIRSFFLEVYKERLKKRYVRVFVKKKRKYKARFRRLKRILRLNRRYGFFEYGSAPRRYDQESRTLSFYGYWLAQYKLFTNFYNNLSIRVLKRLWLKASTGRVVIFNYFLTLLESRIDSLIIRLNWVDSKHIVRQLLRKKVFLVNNYPIVYTNYIVSNFECLTINTPNKKNLFDSFFQRVKKKYFFYRPPFFLEVNHKTLSCLIIQKFVSRTHVKYPFKFKCESLLYIGYSTR